MVTALSRTIMALDNMHSAEVEQTLDKVQGRLPWIKIGLEQYCRYGKSWVQEISERTQAKIFLDLKLHDIPNTVAKAIEGLQGLPISLLTVHLSGGREMLIRAQKAQREFLPDTQLLGVSYLTSLNASDFLEVWGVKGDEAIKKAFERLFLLALTTELGGLVCSAHEASFFRELEGRKQPSQRTLIVCPGIRFEDEILGGAIQDQSRVASPAMAFENGADYLVIGRSLTQTTRLNERLDELAGLKL